MRLPFSAAVSCMGLFLFSPHLSQAQSLPLNPTWNATNLITQTQINEMFPIPPYTPTFGSAFITSEREYVTVNVSTGDSYRANILSFQGSQPSLFFTPQIPYDQGYTQGEWGNFSIGNNRMSMSNDEYRTSGNPTNTLFIYDGTQVNRMFTDYVSLPNTRLESGSIWDNDRALFAVGDVTGKYLTQWQNGHVSLVSPERLLEPTSNRQFADIHPLGYAEDNFIFRGTSFSPQQGSVQGFYRKNTQGVQKILDYGTLRQYGIDPAIATSTMGQTGNLLIQSASLNASLFAVIDDQFMEIVRSGQTIYLANTGESFFVSSVQTAAIGTDYIILSVESQILRGRLLYWRNGQFFSIREEPRFFQFYSIGNVLDGDFSVNYFAPNGGQWTAYRYNLASSVPEPSALMYVLVGIAGLAYTRRRRRTIAP